MLTPLSLWAIYFASYMLDYIVILGISIWRRVLFSRANGTDFWNYKCVTIWCVLLFFIATSLYIINRLRKTKMNTRIHIVPEQNITNEMTGHLLAQVITVLSLFFSDWGILISTVIFLASGVFYVKSKAVHTSPLFVIPLGNRVFKSGEKVIITKYTLQEMIIAQEDCIDGIQARELAPGIYYVKK